MLVLGLGYELDVEAEFLTAAIPRQREQSFDRRLSPRDADDFLIAPGAPVDRP
ncbi:MAG: hypothetical protein QM809_11320 [Gordonia sp. (in: high G+C Gram-positive bacteria)]|uniref:hypothetical protein n=1 Tax=Gordonia sp. (in: high G+C Gram-positive bacteria) TaxID=84139 RepID=UPI0039E545F8